jgi:hypothetical protein
VNDPSYAHLASLLRKRLSVIADQELRERDPDAQLNALRDVSLAITEAAQAPSSELPPRLAHFIERCSFDKALAFIEGQSAE